MVGILRWESQCYRGRRSSFQPFRHPGQLDVSVYRNFSKTLYYFLSFCGCTLPVLFPMTCKKYLRSEGERAKMPQQPRIGLMEIKFFSFATLKGNDCYECIQLHKFLQRERISHKIKIRSFCFCSRARRLFSSNHH